VRKKKFVKRLRYSLSFIVRKKTFVKKGPLSPKFHHEKEEVCEKALL
jgi:hypothetical protein